MNTSATSLLVSSPVVTVLLGSLALLPAVGLAEPAPPQGQTVKVAGIVLKWIRADKEFNYRRAEPLIRAAAARGARIICTTECFLDGYAIADKSIPLEDYRRLGEPIPEGKYYRRLAALAGELKVYLVAGLLEADGDARYNSAVLLGPDGKLVGKYRKQKLGHESERNTSGNISSVFETPHCRVGILICADRTDPALVRRFKDNGADLLICPSGGMFGPRSNDPIVQARSRENKLPILFVHPAEFLVTGPDGSILDRTVLGDTLLVPRDQAGSDSDQHRVYFFEVPVPSPDLGKQPPKDDATRQGADEARIRQLAEKVHVRVLYEIEPERALVGIAFPPIKFNPEAMKTFAGLPQVRRLEYREGEINADQLKTLAVLPRLEALDLRYTTLEDKDLAALAALPRLQSLRLAPGLINDAWLKELGRLKELRELDLDLLDSRITDKGLEQLAALSQLRKLTLRVQQISNRGIKVLATLPQLLELDLRVDEIENDALRELAGCKRLERLSLQGGPITDARLRHLPALRTLQSVSLFLTDVGDDGLKQLSHLENLRELVIFSSRRITDAGIKELVGCKELRKLSLKSIRQRTDASLKHIAQLTQLEQLTVEVDDLSDAQGKALASLKALRYLGLRGKVTGAGLRALARLRQLQELDLYACTGLTGEALKELAAFKELRKINLSQTGIGDAGVKKLAALQELRSLHLNGSVVTDAGLTTLAGLPTLQTLGLCDTRITDNGVKVFKPCRQLRTLDLLGSQVTEAGEA